MRIESKKAGRKERREWLALLASIFIAGSALAGLHIFGVQLCLLNKFTGVPCPVCGSSRAMLLLSRGRMADAFKLQPLATLFALGLLIFLAVNSCFFVFANRKISLKMSAQEFRYVFWSAVFLTTANWLYLLWQGMA